MITCPVCRSSRALAGTLPHASGLCLTWECQVCTTVWERGAGFRTVAIYQRGSVPIRVPSRMRTAEEAAA